MTKHTDLEAADITDRTLAPQSNLEHFDTARCPVLPLAGDETRIPCHGGGNVAIDTETGKLICCELIARKEGPRIVLGEMERGLGGIQYYYLDAPRPGEEPIYCGKPISP